MNLLEFGMQNEQSESLLRRMMAKSALAAEKKRADLYETCLNKMELSFPDGPEEEAALLKKIREQIDAKDGD